MAGLRWKIIRAVVGLTTMLAVAGFSPRQAMAAQAELRLLDRSGSPILSLTDGDHVRLRFSLPEKASQAGKIAFRVPGDTVPLGECRFAAGEQGCTTPVIPALGWYWAPDGTPRPSLTLQAIDDGGQVLASLPVHISPRPVVMVHGFSSDWKAWTNYLGAQGYLASIGVHGFAVGDGQVPGVMNTGRLDQPTGRTNTIAENAAILGEYIEGVKKLTGAQQVDLIGHSMGGLISRYYIDRVMTDDSVAQLIMLGSPMAGTDCAELPASLGYYLPAALEIRPSYVAGIFNSQITHRKGTPFHALAGDPIIEAFKSPCTSVPSDLAVARNSVSAIPLDLSEMAVLHMDLNTSRTVFEQYVRPLLEQQPEAYSPAPDPAPNPAAASPLQFTRVVTGHVEAGGSQEISIRIDPGVTVASFALYDSSRSLQVTVRGASGNVIPLDAQKNGLVVVSDPQALLYLGYGFRDPKPGLWLVTLQATGKTPPIGSDFSLTAQFVGGAALAAETSSLLPGRDETVHLTARLELGGQPLPIDAAQARVRLPDGSVQVVTLSAAGDSVQADWKPSQSGLHAVEISAVGHLSDGTPVERAAFLSVEVQPAGGFTVPRLVLAGVVILGVLLLIAIVVVGWVLLRLRRINAAVKITHHAQK
jgi:pimeloyl-ACP methyl ester carboxylesterase